MPIEFTADTACKYVPVIEAVYANRKVLAHLGDEGEDWGLEGTLRRITPAKGSRGPVRLVQDLGNAWVWVTTIQGDERWITIASLVEANDAGFVRFS